jgi:hypothetical protein
MTKGQIGYVRGLLAQNKLDEEDKEALVLEYTEGRTTHLRDMTQPETQALIKALGGGNSPGDKMRRKILSMAHDLDWQLPRPSGTPSGRGGQTSRRAVDMDRVNNWCMKYFKHKLDDIPARKLTEVVSAFEKMYNETMKGF